MPHGISSFSPFHHQQPPPLEVLGMQPCGLLSSLLPSLPSSLCHLLDSKNRVESELYRPCFIFHEVLLFLHTCVSWLFTQPLHFFFLFPSVILGPHSAVFTQHRFLHMCVTSSDTLRSHQPMKTAPVPFPPLRQQKFLPERSEELLPLTLNWFSHLVYREELRK